MAATVTTSVGVGSVTPATTVETASFTPTGSNKALYVMVGSGAGTPGNPTSVKYASASGTGGESLTLLDSVRTVATNMKVSIWRLASPSAASGTLWAQYASTDDERWIIGVAVQDALGTEGTINFASNAANNSASSTAASTSGELILGMVSWLDVSGSTTTLTGGQTLIKKLEGATAGANGIGVNESALTESTVAAGATTAMTCTFNTGGNSAAYGMFAFQVNPAAGGGGGSGTLPILMSMPPGRYR